MTSHFCRSQLTSLFIICEFYCFSHSRWVERISALVLGSSSSIALPSVLGIGWQVREASNPVVGIMHLWSCNKIFFSWNMTAKPSSSEKILLLILFMAFFVKLKKDRRTTFSFLKTLLAHYPLYWSCCNGGKILLYFWSVEARKPTPLSLLPHFLKFYFSKLRKIEME